MPDNRPWRLSFTFGSPSEPRSQWRPYARFFSSFPEALQWLTNWTADGIAAVDNVVLLDISRSA